MRDSSELVSFIIMYVFHTNADKFSDTWKHRQDKEGLKIHRIRFSDCSKICNSITSHGWQFSRYVCKNYVTLLLNGSENRSWTSNHIHSNPCDAINHPCHIRSGFDLFPRHGATISGKLPNLSRSMDQGSIRKNWLTAISKFTMWNISVASNHRRLDCLFNRFLRRRPKKASKLRVTGLCQEKPPATGEFPAQRASNAENVSIWWRHDDVTTCGTPLGQAVLALGLKCIHDSDFQLILNLWIKLLLLYIMVMS